MFTRSQMSPMNYFHVEYKNLQQKEREDENVL